MNNQPSWTKWPPNCCATCVGPWKKIAEWFGECLKSDSLNYGEKTDSRFRCQDFQRKDNT